MHTSCVTLIQCKVPVMHEGIHPCIHTQVNYSKSSSIVCLVPTACARMPALNAKKLVHKLRILMHVTPIIILVTQAQLDWASLQLFVR